MTAAPSVPTIDLTPWLNGDAAARAAVATEVDAALSRVGFLLVTGHGVSRRTREDVRAAAREFFALPARTKQRYAVRVGGRGWLGQGAEANGYAEGTETPPDLKESWTAGADRPSGDAGIDAFWFQPNVWPDPEVPRAARGGRGVPDGRCGGVADEVLRLLAAALGRPRDLFTRHTGHPTYTLNINWYPGVGVVGEPRPGQYRIGPHTDFGTVTLLDREPGEGGLQVYADPAAGRRGLAGRAVRPGGPDRQHRRPDGPLDRRPLALRPPPGPAAVTAGAAAKT